MTTAPEYVFTRDYEDNNRIWLTDVASRLPTAVQLDGFDISFDAAPPQQWLSPNVSFRLWNIKHDAPEDVVGRYDIVHIRLFGYVLKDDEVEDALKRLTTLLKPGGYIQWGEPDRDSFRLQTTSRENKSDAMEQLRNLTASQDPRMKPTWVTKLPELFTKCGLLNVEADVRDAPPDLAMAMHECNLTLHTLLPRQTKNHEAARAVSSLLPEACRETRAGSCYAFTRWTVVGMKPSCENTAAEHGWGSVNLGGST
ncbi:hypothetical protein JX265_005254 [Neoarthrinium moseri]|uniref:Uncharacterized protein n=1 Tax=Neoarthrinium moseri TaxID=1658444 RepID=A0A9P9WPI2_9PEZI|nr:hypothetical protein JX266_008488 [Neoarthrinium moseri]KAI1873632.1 hypothetical protein JX265_005254 [Neoarthrinium moseri]